jgi:hypothetical protein
MKRALLLLVLLSISSLNSALSCQYDMLERSIFSEPYPGMIGVAFSTRTALDKGLIPAIKPLPDKEALARSINWLSQMRDQLDGMKFQGNLSILLIDSELWSRISNDPKQAPSNPSSLGSFGRLHLQTHASIPEKNDITESVFITSEAALSALVSGRLNFNQAISLGLVRLSKADQQPINKLFSGLLP